ncbi:MAG: hypothetical protein FJ272_02685 [Planctomycetes bacterium]|nr:hypothetical protein [Planctomycetota bacterium]
MDGVTELDLTKSFRAHLEACYAASSRQWTFKGDEASAFRRWRTATRRKLLTLLGGQERARVPLNLRRNVAEETDTFRRERFYYDTRQGLTATAWFVMPKNVKPSVPVVLCPPGHGGGMNQVLLTDSEYKRYPFELVKRGMAVLVPEHIGFGERTGRKGEEKQANHAYFYHSQTLLGQNAMGYLLWDLRRALDVLETLSEVDAKRIGCYGLSLGGEMTLFLAACDPRVKVACISGFLCSYGSSFLAEGHCGCGYVFGLGKYLEHEDIAALIAPRPLLVESATRDPIFPVEVAKQTVERLRPLYALCGVPDRIDQDVFEGKHEISGAKAFEWFGKWLASYGG